MKNPANIQMLVRGAIPGCKIQLIGGNHSVEAQKVVCREPKPPLWGDKSWPPEELKTRPVHLLSHNTPPKVARAFATLLNDRYEYNTNMGDWMQANLKLIQKVRVRSNLQM